MADHIDTDRTATAANGLVHLIRILIREQELQPGERLGSERALAKSLGVSRSDLRTALAVLESPLTDASETGGISPVYLVLGIALCGGGLMVLLGHRKQDEA